MRVLWVQIPACCVLMSSYRYNKYSKYNDETIEMEPFILGSVAMDGVYRFAGGANEGTGYNKALPFRYGQ